MENTNLHDGTGQEQHEAPLRDEKHLKSNKWNLNWAVRLTWPLMWRVLSMSLENWIIKGFSKIFSLYFKIFQLEVIWAFLVGASIICSQLINLILCGELEHTKHNSPEQRVEQGRIITNYLFIRVSITCIMVMWVLVISQDKPVRPVDQIPRIWSPPEVWWVPRTHQVSSLPVVGCNTGELNQHSSPPYLSRKVEIISPGHFIRWRLVRLMLIYLWLLRKPFLSVQKVKILHFPAENEKWKLDWPDRCVWYDLNSSSTINYWRIYLKNFRSYFLFLYLYFLVLYDHDSHFQNMTR